MPESISTPTCNPTRRALLGAAAALGSAAALAPLAGCSLLGIENPYAESDDGASDDAPGTIDFEGLIVALDLDQATWSWTKIENTSSANNGSLVVAIPATVTNGDDLSRVLSNMYCKVVSPTGQTLGDISGYYSDDILTGGSIPAGSTQTGYMHILYCGSGTYTLKFDTLLGRKVNYELELSGYEASGLTPLPAALGSYDAENAFVYGDPFDVGNLTLTLSSNEETYDWTQSWDDADPTWNGRWCVGVPVSITNNGRTAQALSYESYCLYSPYLYMLDDPAPWFADNSMAYVGEIQPNETVHTWLYWVYADDGWYYVCLDNGGVKVVASARIAQYS